MTFEPFVLNLADLNGSNGFRLDGVAALDFSGNAVSSAGDFNGDGIDDLIIGARLADPNGNFSGSSYVVFGRRTGFSRTFNLSSLNGRNGFRIDGVAAYDQSGYSVSSAGDINGDGFDDLIIGTYSADPSGINSGSSYVVFGRGAGFSSTLSLSSLNGSNGFRIDGVAADDNSSFSVSGAGDINGDGFDDLIIGAFGADPNGTNSGSSYVVFGSSSGFSSSLSLSSLNGSNGFRIDGVAEMDYSGRSVSNAGDINGDGFDDLIIGAGLADPNGTNSGSSYVVFGSGAGFSSTLSLSSLNGSNGFRIDGVAARDQSGHSVSNAGDINRDGFDDLIIGAYRADPSGTNTGASYVVFGSGGGFSSTLNLSSLNGSNGFRLDGIAIDGQSGRSVSSAGDFNGDGFDDLIIGAPFASSSGTNSGSSYLVFALRSGFSSILSLFSLYGGNGFHIAGATEYDFSGTSVSRAGDINGDGVDDLIIGATGADPNGTESGSSYVLFGRPASVPCSPFWPDFGGGTDGRTLQGDNAQNLLRGGRNNDTLAGFGGDDTLYGLQGNDVIFGNNSNDLAVGSFGNDQISGGMGGDTLRGDGGNDLLLGGDGNDRLIGGVGFDVLVGGQGADTLVGGRSVDFFRYNSFADGNDIIRDFVVMWDVIDLSPLLKRTQFSGNTALQKFNEFVTLTQVGANTQVFINSAGYGGSPTNVLLATLEGVRASALIASNFAIL